MRPLVVMVVYMLLHLVLYFFPFTGLKLPPSRQNKVIELVGSPDKRQKALRQQERLKEWLKRLSKRHRYLEVEEEEYRHEKW